MPEQNFTQEHRNILFNNNVTMSLRQEPGLLVPLAGSSQNYSGNKAARIENRFSRLRMESKTTRNGKTNNTDPKSTARWIRPGPSANVAPLLDRDDVDVTDVSLTSALVTETAEASRTYHDDKFVEGYFGNAYTGEHGDVAVGFKSDNIIQHGSAGLTKEKLLALKELMKKRNVNLKREMPVLFLYPEDETDLFNIEQYINYDYTGQKPLEMGEIKPWLGFRFFCINPSEEAFPDSYKNLIDGVTRRLPAFVPSGVHRGIWTEFFGKIEELPTNQYSTQIYGESRSAVTRTDEDKCFLLETR